ncbi:MAG TPA: PilZ domain-containing protein [Bdellovibrionales bacterium]|nr:PilZ domain-containing protein [Bdellovibrionales bacterium]
MAARKTKEAEGSQLKVVPALPLDDDHWLILQNETPRKVLGKWLVVLMGPNPKLGQWVLMSGSAQSLESLWRWEARKPKHVTGFWLFYGRKPEYRDGRWAFVSERPELFYAKSGKVMGKRITTNQAGDLLVADNSEGSYKSLSALNDKQVNKVLVGISTEDKSPAKTSESPGKVTVKETPDLPGEEFQKIEVENGNSLARQFRDRLHEKISASAQGGNPLFHAVDDEAERMKLMQQSIRTRAKTEIWSKDRKHRIDASVTSVDVQDNRLTAAVSGEHIETFVKMIKELNDVTCLFSINLQQVQLFFVSSILGHNHTSAQFEMPDKLFEVQRRYSLRYSLAPDSGISVSVENPVSKSVADYPVIDISAGGLAFRADVSEKSVFAFGADIELLKFTIGSREIVVGGSIRHCTTIESSGQAPYLKVGLAFRRLKPRDSNFLNLYVYEQSLQYLSNQR